jgi:hypothetical protein
MKHGPADPLPSISFGLDNSALVVAGESHLVIQVDTATGSSMMQEPINS